MALRTGTIQKNIVYTDTTATDIGALPANAYIVRITAVVATAFNSGGADLIDVGISTDADKFANDINVASTGVVDGTVTAAGAAVQSTSDPTPITATYIPAGTAASAGSAYVNVEFIYNEAQ